MTKQEALQILKLLSALESGLMWDKSASDRVPDYLLEEISRAVHVLEREILT